MTLVRRFVATLQASGVPAIFGNTGGGCFAIIVEFPDSYDEILVTGEDVFFEGDLDSDDDVDGHWHGAFYPLDQDPVTFYDGDDFDAAVEAVTRAYHDYA